MRKNKRKQEHVSIRNKYKKGELAKDILKGLAVGGLIFASFALPNLPQVFSFFGIKNSRDRYRMRQSLKNLHNHKLIDFYEKDGEMTVRITEKGNKKVLKYKFDEMKLTRPKKWDGCCRIISFDIPEKHKKARDALTRKLQDMELYPIQKSVFICPFECRDEVDFIGELFGIRKFIHYYAAKEIDEKDRELLKRYYSLD
jgi:DNA-binding transcriptional regulator PaaX